MSRKSWPSVKGRVSHREKMLLLWGESGLSMKWMMIGEGGIVGRRGEIAVGEEIADHVGAIACDELDEFGDTSGKHGVDGTLEERALSYFKKTFGTGVREGSEALGHTGRENYSDHILFRLQFTVYGLQLITLTNQNGLPGYHL